MTTWIELRGGPDVQWPFSLKGVQDVLGKPDIPCKGMVSKVIGVWRGLCSQVERGSVPPRGMP